MKLQYLLITLIAFAGLYQTTIVDKKTQERLPISIIGIAVDEAGKPIPNPRVAIDYNCHPCGLDKITLGGDTFENGGFKLNEEVFPGEALILYISESIPPGYWSPFLFPPTKREAQILGIRGIPIRLQKGQSFLDLGRVSVKTKYSKIKIDLVSLFGENYLPSEESSRQISLTLLDKAGRIMYDNQLPEIGAFDSTFSTINLALTNSQWKIKLSLYNKERVISSQYFPLKLKGLECKEVFIVKDKLTPNNCGSK